MGIFTDRQMGKQRDLLTEARQIIEGRHGRIDFVAHTLHIDQQPRWLLVEYPAAQQTDHRAAAPRSCCSLLMRRRVSR